MRVLVTKVNLYLGEFFILEIIPVLACFILLAQQNYRNGFRCFQNGFTLLLF